MDNSISMKPSASIPSFYVSSSNLKSLTAQYDQLFMRRGTIDSDESLTHKQKERQLAQLDSELDHLRSQIENLQQLEEKKEQEQELERIREHVNSTKSEAIDNQVNLSETVGVSFDQKAVIDSPISEEDLNQNGKLFDEIF